MATRDDVGHFELTYDLIGLRAQSISLLGSGVAPGVRELLAEEAKNA